MFDAIEDMPDEQLIEELERRGKLRIDPRLHTVSTARLMDELKERGISHDISWKREMALMTQMGKHLGEIRELEKRVRELEAQQAVFLPIVRDVVKYGDCYWVWEHSGELETQAGEIIDTIDRERDTV
jgi:hypothetical protein